MQPQHLETRPVSGLQPFAVMRWQQFSEKLAILEGTGLTFQETLLERAGAEVAA